MLRECEGDDNDDVGKWRVVVSSWHEYVVGTRSSGIVSSTVDVLGMSAVRGMRGVGLCEMCMCLARGGVGG